MKKIIATVLCLCMIFSAFSAFAESNALKQEIVNDTFKDEIIVSADQAEKVGAWNKSKAVMNYDGNPSWFADPAKEGEEIPTIKFKPEKELKAGNYELYFWVPFHSANVEKLDMTVFHNEKESFAFVYPKIDKEETAEPGWVSLGVFDFAGNGDEYVYIAAVERNTRVTAVKFVPTDKASASSAVKGETIVSVENAEKTGNWSKSKSVLNYNGSASWFADPAKEGDVTPTIKFKPEKKLKEGNYELYYWTPFHEGNVEKLDMTVFHNGKESSTYVRPKLNKGETAEPKWVSLGVFDFAGNGDEYVYLETVARNTRATAVKFVPTDKEALGKTTDDDAEKKETVDEEETETDFGDASLPHVVKNDPSGFCKYVGDWFYSSRVMGPMEKAPNSLWIESGGPETYAEYNPNILHSGQVRVSVYLLYWPSGHVDDVKYTVHHNGKVDEFHLNPAALTQNEWITLGTFDFEGDSKDYVRLECTGKPGNTRASTVAFEIMNEQNNSVWQTLYVTPTQDNESVKLAQADIMAKLDAFADMKDHWAHYDVEFMANEGLVAGKGEGVYDPDAQITRAEYVTLLDRAMKYEVTAGETYPDVPADAWYAPYIATAKANGLLNGLPTDDGFKPEQPITREEMALFTYNAIQATTKNDEWVKDLPTNFANFTDTAEISDYAKVALEYLIQTGIIQGVTETTVAPKGNATRAQGAVILKRFMQQFVWAGPPTDDEWVLTFNDEFNGDSVNWDIWDSSPYKSQSNILSTRGGDNAEVHDGALYMMTKKEQKGTGTPKEWTTCHLALDATVFRQKYGYWEARYKICASSGINNAFWLVTGGSSIMSYKQSYEIDINEGHYPNDVSCTYHYKSTGDALAYSKSYRSPYDLSVDYHTYALEWNPDELTFYFDGMEVVTVPNENAHVALVPLLSSAVAGWGGSISDLADGTAQIVDYVRLYQRKKDADNPEYVVRNQPVTPADDGSGIKPVLITEQEIDETVYDGEIVLLPELTGGWSPTSAAKAQEGGRHWTTNEKQAKAEFKFTNVTPGKYKVYFWRLVTENNKPQENLALVKADGTESIVGSVALIPNDKHPETSEVGWVYVGETEIESTDLIRIVCDGLYTRASGLKLVPVK